jgi:tRNA threonylcarbamoyladenosine biosynthesis protein TsaE
MHVERTPSGFLIDIRSEPEVASIGQLLAEVVQPGTVIGLIGPLGAGKTRLSRAVAESLGVDPSAIASPTFVLIHEYEGRIPVYHFDTFRLAGPDEFEALGVSDYWSGDGVCLVEWADRVLDLLPTSAWIVRIEPTGPEQRRLSLAFPNGSPAVHLLERRLAGLYGTPTENE